MLIHLIVNMPSNVLQAVRYYTMVSGVLRKYDSIPSLHKIRVEADALMQVRISCSLTIGRYSFNYRKGALLQGLRSELYAVLRDRGGSNSSRIIESIRLLVQVGGRGGVADYGG